MFCMPMMLMESTSNNEYVGYRFNKKHGITTTKQIFNVNDILLPYVDVIFVLILLVSYQ